MSSILFVFMTQDTYFENVATYMNGNVERIFDGIFMSIVIIKCVSRNFRPLAHQHKHVVKTR